MKKSNMKLNGLSNIITINPDVRNGRACFKNTRIPVDYVLKHLERGWNIDEVSALFPELKKSDIIKAHKNPSIFT